MKYSFTFIIISLVLFTNLYSQDNQDSIAKFDKNVLLIPFSEDLYFNDASREFVENSDKSYIQIQNFIRQRLDLAIMFTFPEGQVNSLINDFALNINEDLFDFYRNVSYKLEDLPKDTTQEKSFLKKIKRRKSKKETEEQGISDGIFSSSQNRISNQSEEKYLKIIFQDKQVLIDIAQKYDSDFIIVATQFEIKSDFSDPLKVDRKTYTRRINVHYCIFDKKGEFLSGNIAYVNFPATNNFIESIARSYFDDIANQIRTDKALK